MGQWILVSSHRRSGTHFLIDSIAANSRAVFPAHRHLPKDLNVGSLFREDERVTRAFRSLLEKDGPVIIKCHLLPEEMDLESPRSHHQELVRDVFRRAVKLYVRRDARDTLLSLFDYSRQTDPKAFLREPNDHVARIREPGPVDENRVRYRAWHEAAWSRVPGVHPVAFEDLKLRFEETIRTVLAAIGEPAPGRIRKPAVPRSRLLHRIQLGLHQAGLVESVACSSVRPRKGNVGDGRAAFDAEDLAFIERESGEILEAGAAPR
jgi:hypothetical protein